MQSAPGGKAPPIDPTYLAMAAATMHEQGRLFEPTKKATNDRSK